MFEGRNAALVGCRIPARRPKRRSWTDPEYSEGWRARSLSGREHRHLSL